MSCINTYKGQRLNDRQLKNLLADGEFERLVKSGAIKLPGLDQFYKLGNSQADVVEKLRKLNDLVVPNDGETYLLDGKPIRRVTSVIKAKQKKKFGAAADQATQDMWEEARATGEKLHLFNQNIVNRLTSAASVLDVDKLSPNEKLVYNHMDAYITDLISLKIKGGSIFLAETRIANPTKNLAGTIDLIEVTPDGKINIYDYKTRSRSELHKIKLDEYSQQLKMYADILESVLNTEVLQRRIVPIKISRKSDGSMNVDIKDQEPVALEKTGLEELDILLDKMYSRLDYLQSQSVPEGQRLAHKEKIDSVQKSIKSIQISKDLTQTIEIGLHDVETIISELNAGTFDLNTNLREAHDVLKLFKEFDRYIPDGFLSTELQAKVAMLITQARAAEKKLEKAEKEYLVANGGKYGIIGTEATKTRKDFLSPVKELGRWDRWIQGASFSEHPVIQTLRRAVEGKVIKTREEYVTIRDNAQIKQKAMFDHLGESTFEPLLQTYESGNKTGKLVDKVRPEYWSAAAKAKKDGDIKWFQENSFFDLDKYNRDLERYKQFVGKSNKLKPEGKSAVVAKWIKENQSNWYKYHSAREKWYDQKWLDITSGKYKGTPVEDFYNYYKETMNRLIENLPVEDIYDTFIPNLKAEFLERSANVGLGNAMKSMADMTFLEVLHDDPKFGKYDADNNPIDNIPVLFTNELSPKDKSYDLGLLLSAFASTSLNYQNLTELEALKEASLAFMRNQDEYITTSKDEVRISPSGQERKKANPSTTSHYGQLKDYVDTVFYGRRRSNEKTKTFKSGFLDRINSWAKGEETVTEREYAWSKLFDGVLQFTALKALGFNLFAPVTNYLSAESTSFMNGVGGLYFNTANKTEALKLLASNNEKAKLLIDKFAVKMGDFELNELNSLKTSAVKMGITDMSFIGFHLGDYTVQNSNFIAMLLSDKHEVKWSDYEVVDGKLHQKTTISELDQIKFRNKAMKVNKKIMGNMDKNDYASIKRYALGRALMQFRNWLPAMFEERWGRKRFDYDLEMWTEGRYKVGWRYMVEHVLKPMFTDTKNKLLEWKNLTDQEKAALKSNIFDLVVITGTITLLGALRADDNEDRSMMSRYSIRVIDRLLAELTFFALPVTSDMWADKYQIIISPAASVSTLEDLGRIFTHSIRAVQGDEEADPARAVKRMVPGINQVQKLDEILSGEVQY